MFIEIAYLGDLITGLGNPESVQKDLSDPDSGSLSQFFYTGCRAQVKISLVEILDELKTEAAANRSLDFEEESSSKTRTLVRASNKTHTIVKGRKSQSAPNDSAHETEVTRGKRRIARKPAPKAQPKLPEVQNWRDLVMKLHF